MKKFNDLVVGNVLYIKNIDINYIQSEITSISKDTQRDILIINCKFDTYNLVKKEREKEFLIYSYSDSIATSMDRLLLEMEEN